MACSNEGADGAKNPNDIESIREICSECICTSRQTCILCESSSYACPGTCMCCTLKRNLSSMAGSCRDITLTPYVYINTWQIISVAATERTCKICICTQEQSPCAFCTAIRFQCEGTCMCCETSRRVKILNLILNGQRAIVLPSRGAIPYLPDCQTTQSILQQRCSVGSTPINVSNLHETQTISSIRESVANPNENNGSRPNGEELMDTSQSNGVNCNMCLCNLQKSPCMVCVNIEFSCGGTCDCCDLHRNIQAILQRSNANGTGRPLQEASVHNNLRNSVQIEDSRLSGDCSLCRCQKNDTAACEICVGINFTCRGNCNCCIDHGRMRNNNQQESNAENIVNLSNFGSEKVAVVNSPHCFCFCQPHHSLPCFYCFLKDFRCGGACKCCPRFLPKQAALHKKLGLKENVQKNLTSTSGLMLKTLF